ncbi:glycoside hydrolase family 1 protein [Spirillospora sp. CA-294931]|uniref:glycoside hydrolase family 1 protein n=1 Tax=Spirillospora sp. CA-294931 TaxID=3240042 RepID=UPI003D8B213F
MDPLPAFPEGFLFGTATAAYQIEGAVREDGRGPSIWDTFCAEPGRVRDGHTGDRACDHYHRWPEDLELMSALGANGYRFSVAWTRVQPDGTGRADPRGLDFYEALVDGLLDRGIAPALTLYHWDLPQALQDAGGWMHRDTAHRFAEYAGLVADRLGDRIALWITLNEPFVHLTYGHSLGVHAPGETLLLDSLPAAHHQLLGHGLAVAALRERTTSPIALTNNHAPVWAASGSPEDAAAVRAYDALHNRLFTDPLLLGRYPDLTAFGVDAVPGVRDGDLDAIAAPLDALGVNYYNPVRVAAPGRGGGEGPSGLSEAGPELDGLGLPFVDVPIEGTPVTAFGWPVVPDGLRELLVGMRDRYGAALPPLVITENGCSADDAVGPDGTVDDPDRIAFLDGHLRAVHRAIEEGVDVRGYFVWSLLDNFEWSEGYHQRFGLVHVDFTTQRRTPKASFHWLRDQLRLRS